MGGGGGSRALGGGLSSGQLVKNLTRRNESEEEERKTLYDYVITLMHAFMSPFVITDSELFQSPAPIKCTQN